MNCDDNEYVIHGPDLQDEIPEGSYGRTVYQGLLEHLNIPIAFIDVTTRKYISFKSIFEDCSRLAHSLQVYGIKHNDVIGISSENSVYYALPLIAGLWLGATVTTFNPQYTPREILHVANISKPTILFCSKLSLKSILKASKELPFLKKIIVLHDSSVGNVEDIKTFMVRNSHAFRRFEPAPVDSQDVALIMYSSGTTGLPKGVMLTNYNLNATYTFFRDSRYFFQRIPGNTTLLGLMPFFHAYGISILLSGILFGNALAIFSKFEERSFLSAVQDFKIKSLSLVPPVANFLSKSQLVKDYDLSHVLWISCGAAPLSKHTRDQLLKRFPKVQYVREGYGLTEATIAAVVTPMSEVYKKNATGKLLPNTSAKIIEPDTGRSLKPGKKGEIWFKGPQIMKGYAGDVENTETVLDKDGWLRTGDIGYYDEDGYIYVIDRLKELIKYKGYQVPPAELEAVLLEHPKIADAGVTGIPDENVGEIPLAFVVKQPGYELTESEVKNYVAEQLSSYKQLRGGVRFVQEIPKNASGKILRKQLREMLVHRSKL